VIRAFIVDDEQPARSELRYLLTAHDDVQIVGEAATAGEALELAAALRYDVVFLDVEMPGLTGLEAAPLVRERRDPPAVVFVTAHDRYAVEAFAVEAFDYLLKPVDPERLARVVERLRERSAIERLRGRSGESVAPVAKIAVVAGGGTELLDFDQVHYVQADGDYSRVHTYDRSYLSTASLAELERRLPSGGFARIHRSHLVNLAKVAGVRRAAPDRFRLQLADAGKTELDVARRQSRALRQRLGL
jgi:two-component system response regulator LytT